MKKFLKSFYFAWRGICDCFKSELNFKIHILAAFFAVLFSFVFKINTVEWMFVIVSVVSVLITEMVNTVIENICDFIESGENEKIRVIKDISAGMVLITAAGAFVTACIIFLPKIHILLIMGYN